MGYNDHLFGNKISRFFHTARFEWLKESWRNHGAESNQLLELGCFDGRSYDYLERKPEGYRGLDANWDGGLEVAQERFRDEEGVVFIQVNTIQELEKEHGFDSFICMETLEHIRPDELPNYLRTVAQKLSGPAFITVPNEVGLFFALKNIVKLMTGSARKYSLGDFWNHTIGRTWKVSNPKGGHRGFNYNYFLKAVDAHFEIVSVTGLPFQSAPLFMNSTIALIARPRG